eukprot:13176032-Alexandrium_andersonii.AAC.1
MAMLCGYAVQVAMLCKWLCCAKWRCSASCYVVQVAMLRKWLCSASGYAVQIDMLCKWRCCARGTLRKHRGA